MSLQIWLPLNGNLKNIGCNPSLSVASVQTGCSVSTDGKLGSCYKNTGTNNAVAIPISFSSNQFSMCAWLRIDTLRSNWVRSFGMTGTGTYAGFGCEHTNGSTLGFHFYKTIDGTNTSIFDQYPVSSEVGKWVHYCMVYDGSKYFIYKNGSQVSTGSVRVANTPVEMNTLLLFGGYPNYYSYHSLNDVRIYDHALSVAEIKELAKGLVCHYKLDNPHESSLTNKYSGVKAAGQCSGNFTRTPLESERGYNYKLTRTGTGSSSWPNMNIGSTYTFTVGKRYYYSCKVRCHKWTSGSLSMRASRSTNDWVTNAVQVCSPSLADGKWHEYYTSQVVNETYTRSGTTVTCAPILEFYSSDQKAEGTVFDMDFDVKDLQVVESDVYVPFIQNEFTSTSVTDCSGYGYDGTRSGTLTPSTDTARYCLSTNFNKSGYIINGSLGLTTTAFTVNIWVKPRTASSQHFLFGTFSTWPNNGIGIYRDSGSNKYNCVIRSAGESTYSNKSITSTLNAWNMITVTYSGTVYTGYLNGVKSFEVTYGSSGNVTHPNIMVGNSKYNSTPASENEEALISDVRLYATCLSADDVKRLYNTAASVAKNGAMLGYEMKEE